MVVNKTHFELKPATYNNTFKKKINNAIALHNNEDIISVKPPCCHAGKFIYI